MHSALVFIHRNAFVNDVTTKISYVAVRGLFVDASSSLSKSGHNVRRDQYDRYRVRYYGQHQLFTWLQNHRSDYSYCPLYQHWTMVTRQCYLSTYVLPIQLMRLHEVDHDFSDKCL